MRNTAIYIGLAIVATSCAFAPKSSISGDGGEVTGVRGTAFGEPTPYGMVLVDRGSMKLGPNADDSTWNIKANPQGMSVESFWMDETEVSNAKYRQFVYWVRDSIIRERLADPAYGGDEEYKIEEDKEGNPVKPYLKLEKAYSVEESDRRRTEGDCQRLQVQSDYGGYRAGCFSIELSL